MATSAMAQDIGATFSRFDDNWLTVLRNGMVEYAATIDGVTYQQEDATDDLAKQIDQVKNFVASGVEHRLLWLQTRSSPVLFQLSKSATTCVQPAKLAVQPVT